MVHTAPGIHSIIMTITSNDSTAAQGPVVYPRAVPFPGRQLRAHTDHRVCMEVQTALSDCASWWSFARVCQSGIAARTRVGRVVPPCPAPVFGIAVVGAHCGLGAGLALHLHFIAAPVV